MNFFGNRKTVNRDYCKHAFEILREASANTDAIHGGEIHIAVSKCAKCGLILETSNAILYSAYRDQKKATKTLITTTIIAFATLIVVVIGLYFDYIKK
jgi:Zn finger protein HypA/HybF involved in hydrogenase expression